MYKNLIRSIIILLFFTANVLAESFSKYNVTGNQRVSKETIINFSKLKKNVEISENDLNKALKNIYGSNFFEEVSIVISGNTLNINVKEYPIIQDIIFNGIKAKKFIELIQAQTTLKPKSSFNKFTLQSDLNAISNVLRKSGYYFSEVEVQQRVNSNNTLNIIYDITMGEKALINEIKFIGDKKFKSSKLRSVIRSEESKFWKFLSRNKFLNK